MLFTTAPHPHPQYRWGIWGSEVKKLPRAPSWEVAEAGFEPRLAYPKALSLKTRLHPFSTWLIVSSKSCRSQDSPPQSCSGAGETDPGSGKLKCALVFSSPWAGTQRLKRSQHGLGFSQVSTDLVSGQVLSYTECRGKKKKIPLLGLLLLLLLFF